MDVYLNDWFSQENLESNFLEKIRIQTFLEIVDLLDKILHKLFWNLFMPQSEICNKYTVIYTNVSKINNIILRHCDCSIFAALCNFLSVQKLLSISGAPKGTTKTVS